MTGTHHDLYRIDWLAAGGPRLEFVRRIPTDDPLLVRPDGQPTQLAQGTATYMHAEGPHTTADCPHQQEDR